MKIARGLQLALVITGIALAIRIAFLLLGPSITASDSEIYHDLAQNLARGRGFELVGSPFAGREPGYPLAVALVYLLGGSYPSAVFFLQAVAGAATCGVVTALANRIAGLRAGLVAGLLAALSPALVAYTKVLLTEVLATLLIAVTILALMNLVDRLSWRAAALSGVVIGVATLTRFNFVSLAIAAPLLLWAGGLRWRAALQHGAVAAGAAMLVLAPWVVRNGIVFHAFIPGRTGLGDIVWSGSYVPWDGLWRGYRPPLTELKDDLSEVEADRKLLRETFKNFRENPGGVAVVWAKKPGRLWGVSGETFYPERLLTKQWQLAVFFVQHVIWLGSVLLAIYVLIRGPSDARSRMILMLFVVSTVTLLPGNPEWRYVIPFSGGLYALAAAGMVTLAERIGIVKPGRSSRSRRYVSV